MDPRNIIQKMYSCERSWHSGAEENYTSSPNLTTAAASPHYPGNFRCFRTILFSNLSSAS